MSDKLYIKYPHIDISGEIYSDWKLIFEQISSKISLKNLSRFVLAVECYQGVDYNELKERFKQLPHSLFVDMEEIFKPEGEIYKLTYPDVTDDAVFGYITRLTIRDLLDTEKFCEKQNLIEQTQGLVIVYGSGASLIATDRNLLIYADMSRWEIQLRMKQHLVNNLGINNKDVCFQEQYKRGFFVDWRICDRLKKDIFPGIDYWLDTNKSQYPKLISQKTFVSCMDAAVNQPFRVVPFFDPGPWGGQWMKQNFELDAIAPNYAWCFDCVPEENSLLFNISDIIFEMPSINLVFFRSRQLLGEPVEARFGQEFPIRFDFLDTMQGGNLSLQVHPNTQYIRDNFGMSYTQDESYYILDAAENAVVYLGLKRDINPLEMIDELDKAQQGEQIFDVDKYVNAFTAKKHDHFLIPAGTVHCSGKNSLVLEISATPFIFTFKLWDWARLGLDNKPRPINIKHGSKVIEWNRDEDYVRKQLINRIETVGKGENWCEERTGLHENEFIETRRHWFSVTVYHETGNSVNVLNLVEGDEVIVESPDNGFAPFVVHYAETFIVPASVGKYTIRPYGKSAGKQCATIKAYVRF
ncbi:MAG: class I mannose-6-phosphate isomerase [Prevotellaceae bacterium]|jgi:mannose-6-phosphate isomerase class I|nr:class I mannose-6-phosphate isomerase [Prevotellaceae bacterium]